jgi:hypothetical protein
MPNVKRNLDKLVSKALEPSRPKTRSEVTEACLKVIEYICDPIAFCTEAMEFAPDPWQARFLVTQSKRVIINVARQSGKSTTAAAKATHRAVLFPKSLIIVVAPVVPQADELLRKVQEHLKSLKNIEAKPIKDNKRGVELENGSRILVIAADEDTLRSYTAHMIIVDEAATVPEAIFEALEPMLLVTSGQLILLGTPKGLKGYFASIWHDGTDRWDRYQVSAWDNPRVPKRYLEELKAEKERLGLKWWFEQEYECSFIAAAQGLVYPFDRKRNVSPTLPRDAIYGWQYVLGIDFGYVDSTAFVVLGWQRDDPNVYVVESMDQRGLTPAEAAEIALKYTKKYPFARMVGDTGGLGKGYVEEARRRFRLPIEPAEKNNKRGYIEIMTGDLRAGLVKVMPGNDALVEEWQRLPWDEERGMPADGYKDHLADAALYAYRATLHYLEEIRTAKPAKGTPEALQLEAEERLEERIREVLKKDVEWWEEREGQWLEQSDNSGPSFLN